ncbi:hypothetical protein BKA70DRAFT_611851 [Coprinopsis sp. MPI-PUGE-AT-0042]|nr:hypothetical protein BKA70DRAFT_621987 [Coprinopsis sp. MPI-PUGE-AT-0042]KAH6903105.1 hypothetical protein BKA70DRAFT_611851 [Coprinopsis sp. MPI-PUGE-AT-0042]
MSELRIVPRKYFPSIDLVLSGPLRVPVTTVPSPSVPLKRLHSPKPLQATDFMKTIDTRFSSRSLIGSALPTMVLKHRRSSSANTFDSQAYYADSSDIETICDEQDEQESGPSAWSADVRMGADEELEWQDEDGEELFQVDEEWWGDVEDELDEEDGRSSSYNGSETDSDTVVEDSTPSPSHNLTFVQRLLWRITKRSGPCPCKTCSPSKLANSSSTSKISLVQARQLAPTQQKNVRNFWNLK